MNDQDSLDESQPARIQQHLAIWLCAAVVTIVLGGCIPTVHEQPIPIVTLAALPTFTASVATLPTSTATPHPTATPRRVTGKIAFTSNRDGNPEIYLMNTDGSDPTRLTDNSARDASPAWSPDGTRIAFVSSDCVDCLPDIYVMNADGSNPIRLTDIGDLNFDPAWSPDGTRIAFFSRRDNDQIGIFVMNADGSNQIHLTSDSSYDSKPTWSPDGRHIAFESDRGGNEEIYMMNADGSNLTRLTNNPAWDGAPAWSPDGKHIAFYSDRDDPHLDNSNAHRINEIYIMNADGSGQTRLTNSLATNWSPAWSSDGKWIVFASSRDDPRLDTCGGTRCNHEIYVISADGGSLTRLTNNPAYDVFPVWSPQ